MKNGTQKNISISPKEYNRIYYEVTPTDFNTNYPDPYRIDRILKGIKDYLNYKEKHA